MHVKVLFIKLVLTPDHFHAQQNLNETADWLVFGQSK